MQKIQLHYLVGDVHAGGHDVRRVAHVVERLLQASNAFDVCMICDDGISGHVSFDDYFSGTRMGDADVFLFNCGNWRFNEPWEQQLMEDAVSNGAGFLLMHGDHPCYWPAVGMAAWQGFERMAGLLWREGTTHGDYGTHHISLLDRDHPITKGLPDFDTQDEIFCGLENPWHVHQHVLVTSYSDPAVISRHGMPGTGRNETVVSIGQYGRGRTCNMGLGHVWPFYTGHGLNENTLKSWSPLSFRRMFVRACEWVATGDVKATQDFSGNVFLHDL